MKKLIFIIMLLMPLSANAQSPIDWTPYLQQSLLYFSSDRVTLGGIGVGAGVQFVWKKNFVANTDFNILWANGNALATRLAVGYQRDGLWSPVIFGTLGILNGQRTEVLSATGQRPEAPVWALGFRGSLLRFKGAHSYASALEFGYGIGPDNGMNLELTVLTVGVQW